ncbi:uncharacterized protein LOC141850568 [Brevipalpus obovatus]|uniref:uncharacterized protein LOC141850568 n=1 Tax=Brevipalpus obovatus TaxID=246614 RepID=UPI003D9EFAAA
MSDFLDKEADVSDVPEDEDVEDGDGDDDGEEEEDDQDGNHEMEPEEGDEDVIDENEVIRGNRKLYQKKMREFFEQEAEVSGSDVSEDEVEDEEDELELDGDGDDEPLDEKEVVRLNQKLLQKKMLDEDRKMILELQERYLKDGDLHSDTKRERKFRWKNAQPTWVDNIYSSSSEESDDEDNDSPKYKFKMKDSLTIERTTITPVIEPTPEPAPGPSTSSAASLMNGPSNSILSYVFRDKTVVEALSSVKRKSSTNRPSEEIKRYKPGRKGPSIFDLYVIT